MHPVAYSRHILQSVGIPAVTQARASNDYGGNAYSTCLRSSASAHAAAVQWNIGITSIFAYAIGLAPSKVGPERTGTA